MIRVVVFLLAVAAVAAGVAWIADRPGDVIVTWMGYRVETSVMVGVLAILALVVVAIFAWTILRGLLRTRENISLFFRHRRAMRGYLAISRGLVAIGAGDMKLARKSADDARSLAPNDPLTLLLTAQSAQMSGDRASAERAFREMAGRDETKVLGLHGLYIEARRRNDTAAARRVAEEAAKAAPALAWAGQAVLDDRCAASDWEGALAALENMKGALDKHAYRRKRAVLLTARALALADIDRDGARAAVLEAVKLAPDLAPAAAFAGRRLAEAGEQRKARRVLEAAWTLAPHPDVAEAYADLKLGDSARERLSRMQKLAEKVPGQLEGDLAVARAALDAREFALARESLKPHLSGATRRVAALMAEIEQTEHGDHGRSREWMSRAVHAAGDPVWTADGVVSDRWLPVTPNGRLDGFEWRVPLAELGVSRPVIEIAPPEPVAAPLAPAAEPAPPPSAPAARKAARVRPVEPVIPLVHVPDDPGPDAGLEGEPLPETVPTPSGGAWQRIKALFR